MILIGGALIALPGENVPVTMAGVFLLGAAAVYAVSWGFYEIGLADELDRARTEASRRAP